MRITQNNFNGESALATHESSHDTFDFDKHAHYLYQNAGQGTYAHGRIHQEVDGKIFVSDLIHKRGHLSTDDILLMEEQEFTEPLVVPSRLGGLVVMAMLPTMNTANGEGDLIGYYSKGVVAFNTHESPRLDANDQNGNPLQKGWDSKRLVNHILNTVSAVGRYALTILPRDHFFRSIYGLHFLKSVIGDGSFNTENVNTISQDVEPLLKLDTNLSGAATGFWLSGHRMFATTGLKANATFSSSSYGRGFVSWNQAITYTEDRSPIGAWEGLWVVDRGIEGIHKFTSNGFLASAKNQQLYTVSFCNDSSADTRGSTVTPIEWMMITGQFAPLGLDRRGSISEGSFEATLSDASQVISIYIRTDQAPDWKLWRRFTPCDKIKTPEKKLRVLENIGKPPLSHRECTWFQIKIEGIGYMEDPLFDLDIAPTIVKVGKRCCAVIAPMEDNYFSYNDATP